MKTVPTFTATIYVGFRERDTGILHDLAECEAVCQRFVDLNGWCVTVTPTRFIYSHGHEPGAAIGVINYPRFPNEFEAIRERALALAERLQEALGQMRVSVVFPDETVMLGDGE